MSVAAASAMLTAGLPAAIYGEEGSNLQSLAFLDAMAQADLVRAGEVTPTELVDAAIRRIERLNPTLNAVITPMYEQALTAAAGRGSLPRSPLAGVPTLLTDLGTDHTGVCSTFGSKLCKGSVPPRDSALVSRLKRVGIPIVGKTNLSEFGLLPATEPELFGPCRNPWDTGRGPGGPSGGAAAAVAAGLVPIAYASGAVQIPAACCGVFGLKPSRRRRDLSAVHAISRSVRDSAVAVGSATGSWPTDPGRLRIAFTTISPANAPLHPDCIAAVRDAAELCGTLGHLVHEADPPIDGELYMEAFRTVRAVQAARIVRFAARQAGRRASAECVEALSWHLAEQGRRVTAARYRAAVETMHLITGQIEAFFSQYDIWLTPVLSEPPLPIGAFDRLQHDPPSAWKRAGAFASFAALIHATGQPAMSVPLFWNVEGMPIGTQFVARSGAEATLLRLAAQLELARPWALQKPPVHI